jgi:hypothetical protein
MVPAYKIRRVYLLNKKNSIVDEKNKSGIHTSAKKHKARFFISAKYFFVQ